MFQVRGQVLVTMIEIDFPGYQLNLNISFTFTVYYFPIKVSMPKVIYQMDKNVSVDEYHQIRETGILNFSTKIVIHN